MEPKSANCRRSMAMEAGVRIGTTANGTQISSAARSASGARGRASDTGSSFHHNRSGGNLFLKTDVIAETDRVIPTRASPTRNRGGNGRACEALQDKVPVALVG